MCSKLTPIFFVCLIIGLSACAKLQMNLSHALSSTGPNLALNPTPTPTPPPIPGGILRAHEGAWGNITIINNLVTQSLGFTVNPGNFLVVQTGGAPNAGGLIASVTGYDAGGTGYPLTLGVLVQESRADVALYYLANSPAITSISITYNSNNGAAIILIAAEYSGLAYNAGIVGTTLTADSGFTGATSWSLGPYTAEQDSLVLFGTVDDLYGGAEVSSAGVGSGFTRTAAYDAGGSMNMSLLEVQNTSAGDYTGQVDSTSSAYRYYDSFVIGFK